MNERIKGRLEIMKKNKDDSYIFAPFALANPVIIRYNSTEHRAQSTEHRAQSTEHRAQSTEHISVL
jgi:hypothetical protein